MDSPLNDIYWAHALGVKRPRIKRVRIDAPNLRHPELMRIVYSRMDLRPGREKGKLEV